MDDFGIAKAVDFGFRVYYVDGSDMWAASQGSTDYVLDEPEYAETEPQWSLKELEKKDWEFNLAKFNLEGTARQELKTEMLVSPDYTVPNVLRINFATDLPEQYLPDGSILVSFVQTYVNGYDPEEYGYFSVSCGVQVGNEDPRSRDVSNFEGFTKVDESVIEGTKLEELNAAERLPNNREDLKFELAIDQEIYNVKESQIKGNRRQECAVDMILDKKNIEMN